MGLGVLWLNALVWCLTQLVAGATMEQGCLEPALHPHRFVRLKVKRSLVEYGRALAAAAAAAAYRVVVQGAVYNHMCIMFLVA